MVKERESTDFNLKELGWERLGRVVDNSERQSGYRYPFEEYGGG